jgi:hypothetical protein
MKPEAKEEERRRTKKTKTYNSRYSLVVTHPTTNLPIWSKHLDSSPDDAIRPSG